MQTPKGAGPQPAEPPHVPEDGADAKAPILDSPDELDIADDERYFLDRFQKGEINEEELRFRCGECGGAVEKIAVAPKFFGCESCYWVGVPSPPPPKGKGIGKKGAKGAKDPPKAREKGKRGRKG